MPSNSPRYDDARVHLDVLGRSCEVEARVRVGESRPIDVLPLARAITAKVAEIGEAVAAEEGKTVSCRAGCGACCRQLVPIAPVEAVALARVVKSLPAKRREVVRRRFAAAVRRLEDLGLLDRGAPRGRMGLQSAGRDAGERWADASARYFAAGIPCPFLENESCSIYADRPLVCREYLAVTPAERCSSLDAGAETTPRPLRMSEVLAEVSAGLAPVPDMDMPLVLALEWAEVHGALLDGTVDGEALFHRLMDAIAAHVGAE